MMQEEYEARQCAINALRAETLEADRAFNAVSNARHDLAEARKRIAAALSRDETPPNHLAQRVSDLEADLAQAEAYARQTCSDRLQQHDAEIAEAEEQDRCKREQEDAARVAGLNAARERARLQAEDRARVKAKREAEEAAFMSRLRAQLVDQPQSQA